MLQKELVQKELARLIIKFENWQVEEENPTLMVSVYTVKKSNITCGICGADFVYPSDAVGDYVGSFDIMTMRLLVDRGILPEKSDSSHNVCSIGKSFKDGKWYGWSHRAIFGFQIGDIVKEGDCCATPGVTEEYLKEHPEENKSLPIGFEAKTEEDCKKMAIAFADSVS